MRAREERQRNTHEREHTATDLGGRALRAVNAIRTEVAKAVIGQAIIDQVLIALLAGGHVLIEGVPGPGQDTASAGARQDFRRPLRASSSRLISCRRM